MVDTNYTGRRVCVTGGAGFIGSHLVDALLGAGAAVVVLDDFSSGSAANLPVEDGARLRIVEASILDEDSLIEALQGVDMLFHLAAYVSAPGSVLEPVACHDSNTSGTLRVLMACEAARVRRVVFASSSAVYGDSEVVPKLEDHAMRPMSPYAQSKAAGEHLMGVWSACHGLETVCLRFFNVFGPRQQPNSAYAAVIAAFASRLLQGLPPRIYGDGSQTRDFVPVRSIVRANMLAGCAKGPLRGEAFNIGRGESVSVLELAAMMSEIAGVDAPPEFAPARNGDVRHSLADISRARERLGYEPAGTLEEGVRTTLEWCAAQAGARGEEAPALGR